VDSGLTLDLSQPSTYDKLTDVRHARISSAVKATSAPLTRDGSRPPGGPSRRVIALHARVEHERLDAAAGSLTADRVGFQIMVDPRRGLGASSAWRRLHVGDARNLAEILPNRKCLNVTITSPPYGPTIDYGHDAQIGFGQTYESYLADMQRLLDVLWERTRDTGSLWLIVDTYKQRAQGGLSRLVPLPFDLAKLAENAGWTLQDVVIWHKDHTLPWSGQGRLRNSFEYVLMFAKGRDFKYRLNKIRDVAGIQDWWHRYPERYSPSGAAPTNVWTIPIPRQGSWGNGLIEHRCPLPDALVQRIVELSTDRGDIVCAPSRTPWALSTSSSLFQWMVTQTERARPPLSCFADDH